MTQSKPTLLSRFQGCLMGVALGDAMGMPWETMSRRHILRVTDGVGVTGFVDPKQRTSSDTAHLKAGDTTDDTQLTVAVAESIIRKRAFVAEDMAQAHVQAYHSSAAGWGDTTKQAMQEFDLWTTSHGQRGRKPWTAATNSSRGNGVAMKVAPLALFHQRKEPRHLLEDVQNLGRMTHGDSLAWITAYAVALIINDVTQTGECEFARLVPRIRYTEGKHGGARHVTHEFSRRLDTMNGPYFHNASTDDLLLTTGCGFDAIESVSVAIACAMRHLDDPRAGLLEAINCGGDTDTNASMAGAILGARNGIEGWPLEWRTFRPEYASTLDLAQRLHAAARFDTR